MNSRTSYERVLLARDKNRPVITEYVEALFDDFIELKGDRLYGDDESIFAGIGLFGRQPVTVIGHRKGRTTEENIKYNFGMTSPQGYRKAVRLMRQAERFQRPIICFVDTPGAYPGVEAEAMGQSNAIAESIAVMMGLNVPTITIVTGEGSSGGALALAAADRVYMLENAVYSILSPEGFATILWKDAQRAQEACDLMKITSYDLLEAGVIDGIIKESRSVDEDEFDRAVCFEEINNVIKKELKSLSEKSRAELVSERYQKYRKIGNCQMADGKK